MLVKATDFEFEESSEAPEAGCIDRSGNVRCSERRGRFVNELTGKAADLPSNPPSTLDRAQNLLDGFESRPWLRANGCRYPGTDGPEGCGQACLDPAGRFSVPPSEQTGQEPTA